MNSSSLAKLIFILMNAMLAALLVLDGLILNLLFSHAYLMFIQPITLVVFIFSLLLAWTVLLFDVYVWQHGLNSIIQVLHHQKRTTEHE